MDKLHNYKHLKSRRKELRNNGTSAEASLWKALQKSQLSGRKFRRQASIGDYIVDFYCPSEKLIIELDGDFHFTDEGLKKDKERDEFFTLLGFRVLHFENDEVFQAFDSVIEKIKGAFTHHP